MIINGKYYESVRVDSPEYKALMKQWSDEAFKDEMQTEHESYIEHEDATGRLPVK